MYTRCHHNAPLIWGGGGAENAGHENAGHEIDGPITGHEIAGYKSQDKL